MIGTSQLEPSSPSVSDSVSVILANDIQEMVCWSPGNAFSPLIRESWEEDDRIKAGRPWVLADISEPLP